MNSTHLDRTFLDEIFPPGDASNQKSFSEFIKIFDNSCGRNLMKLSEAAAGSDFNQIMAIAHVFKGVAGGVGAERLVELCRELEKYGKEGRLKEIKTLNSSIAEEIKKVTTALEDYARGFLKS